MKRVPYLCSTDFLRSKLNPQWFTLPHGTCSLNDQRVLLYILTTKCSEKAHTGQSLTVRTDPDVCLWLKWSQVQDLKAENYSLHFLLSPPCWPSGSKGREHILHAAKGRNKTKNSWKSDVDKGLEKAEWKGNRQAEDEGENWTYQVQGISLTTHCRTGGVHTQHRALPLAGTLGWDSRMGLYSWSASPGCTS